MTSNALQKLIRGCVDDGRTLRHESKLVDAVRAEALTQLVRERERFVTDLEHLAKREQPHGGSWSELAREAVRDVWVAAAGRNNGDAIRSCRHSRARTEALYDEALQTAWPDEIQRVLAEQRGRLRDEADELIKLLF
jgi:Copper binding octapeptide repeat